MEDFVGDLKEETAFVKVIESPMKKITVGVIYAAAVSLLINGWLSKVFPISLKLLLTLVALVLSVLGVFLQTKWRNDIR